MTTTTIRKALFAGLTLYAAVHLMRRLLASFRDQPVAKRRLRADPAASRTLTPGASPGTEAINKEREGQNASARREVTANEAIDPVDEAARESFPASDPPSWSPSTTGAVERALQTPTRH